MKHPAIILLSLLVLPALTAAAGMSMITGPQQRCVQPGSYSVSALEVKTPIRTAVSPSGTILISDHEQRKIVEAHPGGFQSLREIPLKGRPIAVAALGRFVYVSHDRTDKVQIFGNDGVFVGHLGGSQTTFAKANDIAVDPGLGLLVVVDSVANEVKVFDVSRSAAGIPLLTIPPAGPDPTLLVHPAGIAVDPVRAEILVSDYGATENSIKPRIQIFDYQGNLLSSISGTQGMMGYRFYRPQGLTVNEHGRIYVADSYLGQVLVLDRTTGATVTSFGTFGTGAGELRLPLDVAIAGYKRDLFVMNYGAGRVEVYAGAGGVQ